MNIVVVDDDQLVGISLKTILEARKEVTVVALGNDGMDAIDLYFKYKPDVLLMDIRMEGMSGLEAAKTILKKDPTAKILFLTTFLDDEYIVQALHMGAKGYLLKQEFDVILPALKAVESGQSVFGGEIVSKLPELLQHKNEKLDYKKYDITEKEYEVMGLVAKGYSNKEIAEELYLSEGTVRNYLSNVLDKLKLRDRTQLAIFYLNQQ